MKRKERKGRKDRNEMMKRKERQNGKDRRRERTE